METGTDKGGAMAMMGVGVSGVTVQDGERMVTGPKETRGQLRDS